MKKAVFYLISLILLVGLCSCTSTAQMNSDPVLTDPNTSLEEKLSLIGFPKVSISSDIDVYYDGEEWAKDLVDIINSTESYIVATSFLASECDENEAVFNALVAKAQQGIPVYLIADSTAAMDMTESKNHLRPLDFLREFGVHYHEYNPLSLNRIIDPLGMFMREHRKFFVIDGHTVITGGMNLNYISNTSVASGKGQRDSMYVVESEELASVLLNGFVEFWNTYSWDEINIEDMKTVHVELPEDTQWYNAYVVDQIDSNIVMPKLIASMFNSAKEEILILPFLPLADSQMTQLIENATDRGVDVQIILPNDPRTNMYKAAHYSVGGLMDAGVEILAEQPTEETEQLLHEKLIIVDSRYVLIGSVNFNYRSMVLSQEIGLLIDSPEFASLIKDHYSELKERTVPTTYEQAQEWQNLSAHLQFLLSFITG